VNMRPDTFSEWQLPGNTPQRFAVNLLDLKKFKLREAPVTLTFNGSTAKCEVHQDKPFSRNFSLNLLERSEAEVPVPKLNFTMTAKMPLEPFHDIIDDAGLCGDVIRFKGTGQTLEIEGTGDLLTYHTQLTPRTNALLDYTCTQTTEATFDLPHLQEISNTLHRKCPLLAEIIELQLSSDFPILITTQPKELKTLSLRYFLAPRIYDK